MLKFLPKDFPWGFRKRRKKEQERERAKKDILVCKKCEAFYWNKSWHHNLEDYPHLDEEKNIEITICPACKMIEEGKYEGEVIIENVDETKKEEIINLIKNFGQASFRRDPLDRIISIEEIARGMIRVLATENQMARRLAKKLGHTYKGRLKFIYSKQGKIVRARVIFT